MMTVCVNFPSFNSKSRIRDFTALLFVTSRHSARGPLQVAMSAAQQLDDPAVWEKLSEIALQQGNHQVTHLLDVLYLS